MSRSARFVREFAWTAAAFVTSLITAFVISPLIVKGLGIAAYGVWVLVFSTLEYLSVVDLGVRSATVKYVAHYETRGETKQLHQTLNASIVYFMAIALTAAVCILGLAGYSVHWFKIEPAHREEYVFLMRLAGVTMALHLLFNVARAALEAVQDFVTLGRINIIVNVLRAGAMLTALWMKTGLTGLGWAQSASAWVGYGLVLVVFLRRFPGFRPSWREFDSAAFRQLLDYGLPTLVGSLALQVLHFGPPMLLGILKDTASVGYYGLVLRLLSGVYEIISQSGSIIGSAIARLSAQNENGAMQRAILYLNRYSLALFGFVTVFLLVFGHTLFRLWVGPALADECVKLLPWMVLAYTFGSAANQSSIATLYGLGAHRAYTYGMAAEAVVLLLVWYWFVPDRPLWFAAAWWSVSLLIMRGLRPTWLACRALGMHYGELLAGIHLRPVAASLVTAALLLGWAWVAPPANWWTLGAAACAGGCVHLLASFWLVLAPEHRRQLLESAPWQRGRGVTAPV